MTTFEFHLFLIGIAGGLFAGLMGVLPHLVYAFIDRKGGATK